MKRTPTSIEVVAVEQRLLKYRSMAEKFERTGADPRSLTTVQQMIAAAECTLARLKEAARG